LDLDVLDDSENNLSAWHKLVANIPIVSTSEIIAASISEVLLVPSRCNRWRRFATNIWTRLCTVLIKISGWIVRVFTLRNSERSRKTSEQDSDQIISESVHENGPGLLFWISKDNGGLDPAGPNLKDDWRMYWIRSKPFLRLSGRSDPNFHILEVST
jgi:hypothetical protein